MRGDRLVRSSLSVLLFLAAAASLPASPRPQTPQQPAAGKITALIPTGSVLREQKTYEAKKDMGVFWQDTVKTERGGRARLRLEPSDSRARKRCSAPSRKRRESPAPRLIPAVPWPAAASTR